MTKRQKAARIGGDLLVILAILILGIALLTLAVPRTVAHVMMLPGKSVLSDMARGVPASADHLRQAIAGHRDALRWFDNADGWIDIGAFTLALAGQTGPDGDSRKVLLDQSQSAIVTGLSMAPQRPYAWSRLAQVQHIRDAASPAIGPLLHMSMATGALEPRLLTQRVRIGYAARAALSDAMTARIQRDVRLWALHEPDGLADWGRRNFALPWIRRALAGDQAVHTLFLSSYLRLPAR